MFGLEQIYLASGAIGFIYVVGTAVLGHMGEHGHDAGGHGHVHDGGSHVLHGHGAGHHGGAGHAGHGGQGGGAHGSHAAPHGAQHHGGAHSHGGASSHHAGDHGGHGHDSHHGDHDGMKSSKAELATTFSKRMTKADKSSNFFFLMMRFLNPMRIALILFLFGLTGFFVLRAAPLIGPLSLLPAAGVSLVASNFFLALLGRLMSKMETTDTYRKEDAVGAVGHLTVPISENGTGEVVFVFAGSKSAAPARAFTSGAQISKMSKVIITDIRDGVYYVEPWDEVNGEVIKLPRNEKA